MASCPGPSTSFSAQITVITETRTRTILETGVPPPARKRRAPAGEGGEGLYPTPTAHPAALLADKGRLIPRQGTSLTDLPSLSDPLPTDDPSTSVSTPGTSASDPTSTSDGITTQSSTNGDTTSSTSSPISTSSRSSTISAIAQVTTEVVVRTETIQVPIGTITPACPPGSTISIPPSASVPLSTFVSGSSSGLWSSVVVTTVVTSGGSRSTIVTAVPTLISFASKQSASQLQPGAVAGIVVGSLAALVSMMIFACVFSRRRKRQQKTREMTERVTIGRMLESEGFEDGAESPYNPDHQLPAPGYSSYEYGVVGSSPSPTRQPTIHSSESVKGDSSPRLPIYGQINPGGMEIMPDFNVAANKRAIAARASGSSSGSIFRENFEPTNGEEPGPVPGALRSSPPPFGGHGGHGGSIHEPLIRGTHDRFPSTSSGGSAPSLGPSPLNSAPYVRHFKANGPPPISYAYPLQPNSHHDAARSPTHPPISYPQRRNWSSSSLPPGAAMPNGPPWNGEVSQPGQLSQFTPSSPQEITSAVHSNSTHTTEPYFFLPDASDSYLLPRLSADNPSLLQDSDLIQHATTDLNDQKT